MSFIELIRPFLHCLECFYWAYLGEGRGLAMLASHVFWAAVGRILFWDGLLLG